jgi:hypothetical protein
LSVAGEPARAVDYVVGASARAQHLIIVLVGHGEWLYSIRAGASPVQYQSLNTAFGEVIRNWHWT